MDYGYVNSEKEFIEFFKYLKPYYDKSDLLQKYFNVYFTCALFNYQTALQYIIKNKMAQYP